MRNPEKMLTWRIDGKVIQTGGTQIAAPPLSPGKHKIEVIYRAGKRLAKKQINIIVPQPDEVHAKWLNEMERF